MSTASDFADSFDEKVVHHISIKFDANSEGLDCVCLLARWLEIDVSEFYRRCISRGMGGAIDNFRKEIGNLELTISQVNQALAEKILLRSFSN